MICHKNIIIISRAFKITTFKRAEHYNKSMIYETDIKLLTKSYSAQLKKTVKV